MTALIGGLIIGCGNDDFQHLPDGRTIYTDSNVSSNTTDSINGDQNDPSVEDERDYCTPIECGLHDEVNAYRDDIGLAPLSLLAHISEISRMHSEDMALGAVSFGHSGFLDRVNELRDSFSILVAAENVATNQGHSDPISVALEEWLHSEGHRDNLEGVFSATGVGVAQANDGSYYFTQIYLLLEH